MLRQAVAFLRRAIVEAGGIVVLHGGGVIAVVGLDQEDFFQTVFIAVELLENLCQVLGDGSVADQFPLGGIAFEVIVEDVHIHKLLESDFRFRSLWAVVRGREGNACHIAAEVVGNGLIIESLGQGDALFQLAGAVQGSAHQRRGRVRLCSLIGRGRAGLCSFIGRAVFGLSRFTR